ncbi:HalOD1 output domain-containing protein [Halostella sp. PRR32]|uniref:HalOD1 output domain-containing protein n=1 Tax=Halostella sp. PRR32 TaxID=3098147 RepID=UPI002B1DA2FB|nr:HalOD1 output domain-containing protein [Halostella sp. PRR32]
MHSEGPVGVEIAKRIASIEDVDPTDLEPPLYDAIDLDALDAFLRSSHPDETTVEFRYEQYSITVDSAGDVCVDVPYDTASGSQSQKRQTSD